MSASDSPIDSSAGSTARLPVGTKLLFGLGDWGPSTATAAFMFFFPFFLTDVAHLSPLYAAPVLLVGGAWDALNVPLIGALTDRTRTRWGRRRPFFLFGALPFALAFALLWYVPPFASQLARAAYYAAAYVLYDTAFSLVAVPYAALTPELAQDYDERTRLNAYRSVVSMVGGLVTAVAAPAIVGAARSPRAGYQAMALALGLLGAVPFVLLFAFVRERRAPAPPRADAGAEPAPHVFRQMRGALANRAFRSMAAIYLCAWVTVSLVAAMFEYYVTYCFGLHDKLPLLLGMVQLAALASVPAVVWLAERVGKRGALAAGALWWAGVLLLLAVVPARATAVGYALAVAVGPGLATAHVVPWAMIPDVIEADERATGQRREGLFYGMLALVQKGGAALALATLQGALAAAGYVAGAAAQSPRTLAAIRALMGPLPAALLVGAALLAWRFPLTRAAAAAPPRAAGREDAGPTAAPPRASADAGSCRRTARWS